MGRVTANLNIPLPLDHIDFHIMLAIIATPLDSYRILQFVDELSNNIFEIGLMTIYEHITRLHKDGWIQATNSPVNDGNPHRKLYELTAYGKRVLKAEIKRIESLVKHANVVGLIDDH